MTEVRVVAAVWIRAGRVFAARRAPHKSQAGLWELPGGKVEAGEADETALARELREELGLEAAVGAYLAESVFSYSHATVRLVAYAVTSDGADPHLVDHDATQWLAATDLAQVEWAPADVPLLPAVKQRLLAH